MVGLVSVYYDLMRWQAGSAACVSVWQHVHLSEQLHPRDLLLMLLDCLTTQEINILFKMFLGPQNGDLCQGTSPKLAVNAFPSRV